MSAHAAGKRHTGRSSVWSTRLGRAREALQRGGPLGLAIAVLRRYVVDYRRFFLYERSHLSLPEGLAPRLDLYEERFVRSNDDADVLARDHEDLREAVLPARRALDRGAVAFCVYVGRELGHVAWLATCEDGRRALDHLGFEVRFDQGEAWTGSAWTAPEYRGWGLLSYGSYRRFEYLARLGFPRSRGAVEMDNFASQRANEKFNPCIYASGRQWRLFRWRWWAERASPPCDAPQIPRLPSQADSTKRSHGSAASNGRPGMVNRG